MNQSVAVVELATCLNLSGAGSPNVVENAGERVPEFVLATIAA